jgi:acyl CoA:acetate/3-ketoacid CoA transferase beta subunit/acyl CoA:acetate/3-ketoacid CoA transferase alpha subunit
MDLAEAVRRFVAPGAAIHLAYSGGRPNAAVAEVVRQFRGKRPGFTISAHGLVNIQHALIGEQLVDRLCVAFAGENYPAPRPSPVLQRAVAAGDVSIENWSLWTLTARLIAAALGVEAFPVRSLAESGLGAEHLGKRYVRSDPFGIDPDSGLVRSLRPDIVLLQAVAADPTGNVVLAAPYGEGVWGAMASRGGVIACVEEIVDEAEVRRFNTQPVVPGHLVRAVCRVPRGSHPYGLYTGGFPGVQSYAEDARFIDEVQKAARDPEAFASWTLEWITGVSDHAGYLKRLDERAAPDPARAVLKATRRPAQDPAEPPATATAMHPPSVDERMVLTAARIVGEKVRIAGHNSIVAGIGLAHLAAWVAAELLSSSAVPVQLLAEIGMSGFTPLPGDPYLFASQNLPGCVSLTDVLEVLGTLVSGPASSCIGVLGAGQIDRDGNLNSTWSDDGQFLVGSGGANDIASAAEEVVVVVKHAPGRLVVKLPYITAPGRRVTAVVTTKGVFERIDGDLVLTGYVSEPGKDPHQVIEDIRACTGWDLIVDDSCRPVPEPELPELALLRAFDPEEVFLKNASRFRGQRDSIEDDRE